MKMLSRVMLVIGLLLGGSVFATPIIGSITSAPGGGLTATASWDNGGATLSWVVQDLGLGNWQYDYDFTVAAKNISHTIVGVSDTFTENNVLTGTSSGWELAIFGPSQPGQSNPGMPSDLYGMKFPGVDLSEQFTIVTNRAPMWGSFYAKDGKDDRGTVDVIAYNTSFGLTSNVAIDGPAPNGWTLVPDTKESGPPQSVPEPGTLGLACMAIFAFAVPVAWRRRKLA